MQFFGNIYTPEGIKPDPSKIDAIKRMEAPSAKQELQSFLGMVNYLSSYIHHMSDLTSNLRNLLKKDSLFQWTQIHEAEFQMLKKAISKDVNLQNFNPKKQVVLQVDASQVGLGAALLQDSKVIAYASKSLTHAETRYANIEHEMLTVVFGCLKFHHYLYGISFVCNSDHQPLETIHLKHLSDAPPRLQRLLLKLQPYDFMIKYLPGHKVAVADALSRVSPSGKTFIRGLDVTIHEMTNQTYVHNWIAQIQKETREDHIKVGSIFLLQCTKHASTCYMNVILELIR